MRPSTALALALFLATAPHCPAWSGFDVTDGPLRLRIDEVADVTNPAMPVTATVHAWNVGKTPLRGMLAVRDLVDDWTVTGTDQAVFALEPGEQITQTFTLTSGPFVFPALYPVHAYATLSEPAGALAEPLHAVRIFSVTDVPRPEGGDNDTRFTAVNVPAAGACFLWPTRAHRVMWQRYDGPAHALPAGWTGSEPKSRASCTIGNTTRGTTRPALSMHPPWHGGGGTVFCDYLLSLPDKKPLTFQFANAIRDHGATEPASDGVLFRVWVGTAANGSDAREVFARFTDAKRWVDGSVDLSAYAGKTILLRLESHPGPKHSTTCDSSFWAEPMVLAGQTSVPAPAAGERENARSLALRIARGTAQPDGRTSFRLAHDGHAAAAVLVPGIRGLLDGVVCLATGKACSDFKGFELALNGESVSRWPSPYILGNVTVRRTGEWIEHIHTLEGHGTRAELVIGLRAEGPVLHVAARCAERITQFGVGTWSQRPRRVYYGHGYCIENPTAFRAGFGGHNLAASHVGADFEDGASVLQAVDNPPDRLRVDPDNGTFALTTHHDCVLTLVPGDTAFACAVRYRPYYDKQPARGVRRLAGLFCFDIWGGRYASIAERMQEMIDYGLTDTFLTVHNWQRWGYDYRLPDIYPPNPAFGSMEDMRKIATVCGTHDIPWGLHDNYIDFYPDATGYSYRDIYFTGDGKPHRAWYNQGREALSYKWRPDRILPFVRRNYALIAPAVKPTHSFVDVFTSQGCQDYYDHEGRLHPSTEMRRYWGECFTTISDALGDGTVTTSEAGHDQLIGYLDGADCQWLTLTREAGQRHMIRLPCEDWERVPWYDAVNHHRFILHGVGYSTRYQGERPREAHGINSDDYISAEILSGHALMVDSASWGRDAVRKYYLAQDVARHLALGTIAHVTFANGNVHRQRITWENGTVVQVNRGTNSWQVNGHNLPPYGYVAAYGDGYGSSIVCDESGRYLESSIGPSGWYCNARTVPPGSRRHRITPRIEAFKQTGDRSFEWTMVWNAQESTRKDLPVYVHFCTRDHYGYHKIHFQDDHSPSPPTSTWNGDIRIRRRVTVPADISGDIRCAVGLHDHGRRLRLGGTLDSESRVVVGNLKVGKGTGRVAIQYEAPPPATPLPPRRWNPGKPVLDFGFARTDGAFRVQRTDGHLTVTPLPNSAPCTITLNLNALAGRTRATAGAVQTCGLGGTSPGTAVTCRQNDHLLTFRHDGEALCYKVTLAK